MIVLVLNHLMNSILLTKQMNLSQDYYRCSRIIFDLLKERAETGRIYLMNIDHCNSHSSFIDKVEMSNLCQEITLPTKPIQHIDDETGEIALCILSAINIGKIRDVSDLKSLCDLSVRSLDELIDFQGYPVRSSRNRY